MLRALKWLFYLIAAAALMVVGGSFLLPSKAAISRSIEIAAPPEKVFVIVGDLRRMNEFSPWAEIDPGIKYTFEGPESGVGQEMNWTSNNPEVGSGTQTINALEPPGHVESRLNLGPMGKAYSSFDLVPSATGTHVTWTFSTDLHGIPAKWFGLMLERQIGPHYARGLERLKAVAEQPAPAAPQAPEAGVLEPEPLEPAAPEAETPVPEVPAPSLDQPLPEPVQPPAQPPVQTPAESPSGQSPD